MKYKIIITAVVLTLAGVTMMGVPATNVADDVTPVESWMKSPFTTGPLDETLRLEPWMTAPFDAGLNEEEIILEPWMAAPFDASGEAEVSC